jgi:hypothetical protein
MTASGQTEPSDAVIASDRKFERRRQIAIQRAAKTSLSE